MKKWMACGLIAIFGLVGCATMFGQKSDMVRITSVPEGAEVYFDDAFLGKTPLDTEIERRSEATYLTLKKSGFEDARVLLHRKIAPVAFFNLGYVFTTSGASSWGTDAITGRMWEYAPKRYVAKLESATAGIWNQKVFDFVMGNPERLQRGLARRAGPEYAAFCSLIQLDAPACAAYSRIEKGPSTTVNSLELYRGLYAADARNRR